jgi:hypothetical protein
VGPRGVWRCGSRVASFLGRMRLRMRWRRVGECAECRSGSTPRTILSGSSCAVVLGGMKTTDDLECRYFRELSPREQLSCRCNLSPVCSWCVARQSASRAAEQSESYRTVTPNGTCGGGVVASERDRPKAAYPNPGSSPRFVSLGGKAASFLGARGGGRAGAHVCGVRGDALKGLGGSISRKELRAF